MKKIYVWWWLGYPVVVIFLVAFSFNVLFNGGELARLTVNSEEVAAQAAKVAVVSQKVATLESLNVPVLDEQIKKMVLAVPAAKPVWQTVSSINISASSSGAVIDGYKSTVGTLKVATISAEVETGLMMDVEYSEVDFPSLLKILATFDSRLPLTNVTKLDMSAGKVVMSINSLWKPWLTVSQMGDAPLPDGFINRIKVAMDKLGQFEVMESIVGTESGSGNVGVTNPF